MTLRRAQEVIARILVDESFRNDLRSFPEEYSSKLHLTDEEWRVIRSIPEAELNAAAAALPKKRIRKLESLFPHLRKSMGPDFDRVFKVFAAEVLPGDELQEADNFEALISAMAKLRHVPPYLPDIVRYDRILVDLRFPEEIIVSPSAIWYPRLTGSCRMMKSSFDIALILERLSKGDSLDGVEGRPMTFLVRRQGEKVLLFRLSSLIASALERCNGKDTIDQIANDHGVELSSAGASVRKALEEFRQSGVLL